MGGDAAKVTAPPDMARKHALSIALLALAGGVAVFAPFSLLRLRRDAASLQAPPAVQVQVVAGDLRFVPDEIHVPRGTVAQVQLVNQDPTGSPHDFQTFGQYKDARLTAWPGERNTATFTAPDKPGRYAFICTLRGHADAGMRGTIVVE